MEFLEHIHQAKQLEYLLALAGLFGFIVFWRVLNGPVVEAAAIAETIRAAADRIGGFIVPENVYFHPGHSWARIEDDGTVTVGMDDFASKLVGKVDALNLPKIGDKLKQGAMGWSLEADSRTIEMLSPVDGKIASINLNALNSPEKTFNDPYNDGWLMKIKPPNLDANLHNLMPPSMVGQWMEGIRESLSNHGAAPVLNAMYQDGGVPIDGIAKALDAEKWDEIAREYFLTTVETTITDKKKEDL